MDRYKIFIMALSLCVLLAGRIQAEDANDVDGQDETAVRIVLTKFDVNDQSLDLGWKIKNSSDHDIWVCDSANTRSSSGFEVFLAKDAKTLVIRKRFYLPKERIISEFPLRSRYVPLCAGEERTEFWSRPVPIRPLTWFGPEQANAEYASRLVLEIGFYDEDLPGMILHIVEVAEKLSCDINMRVLDSNDIEIFDRFFGGFAIESAFYNDGLLRETVEGSKSVMIPYMRQVLHGEQVLRWTVDGVSIPYEGNIPLTSHGGKRTSDQQRKQASSTDKEKPDPEKSSDPNGTEKS